MNNVNETVLLKQVKGLLKILKWIVQSSIYSDLYDYHASHSLVKAVL